MSLRKPGVWLKSNSKHMPRMCEVPGSLPSTQVLTGLAPHNKAKKIIQNKTPWEMHL